MPKGNRTKPPASRQRGGMTDKKTKSSNKPSSGRKTPRVTLRNRGYGGILGALIVAGQDPLHRKKF